MNKNNKFSGRYPVYVPMIVALFSLVCFWGANLVSIVTDLDIFTVGIFATLVFTVVSALFVLIMHFVIKKQKSMTAVDENMSHLESNLTVNLLSELYLPIVLCDDNDKIVWYNNAFGNLADKNDDLYGNDFSQYCPLSTQMLLDSSTVEGPTITAFDSYFEVKAYKLPFEGAQMTLTVWNDCSDLENYKIKIASEEPIVAFITIDNIDEVMKYAKDMYRTASAEVEGILRLWAESVNSIFREYERDKFLMIFEAKHLAHFVATKFDVLDKIRNVNVGEGNQPITVSIGISKLEGNLEEKEKASQSALDTALQRGGDQVVLRTENGTEFYGGRVQSLQNVTKVKARVVADELARVIGKCSNVLVMAHAYPDYDAIGAQLGIYAICRHMGVKVNIVTNKNSREVIQCFSLTDDISEETLVDKLEAAELVNSDTLLIICDVNNKTQFEAPELAETVSNMVFIDHHIQAPNFDYTPVINYIQPANSSSCEMVSEIVERLLPDEEFDREIANIMLAGIMLDTKQFSRNTSARTFGAALYLRNVGANPADAGELFKTGLDDFMREAHFESNVSVYKDQIAIAKCDYELEDVTEGRVAAAKAADKMLNLEGINASFAMFAFGDDVQVSGRSRGKINVQLILEKLGGGGRFDSAATLLRDVKMSQAVAKLKVAIEEYLDENKETEKDK